VRKTLTKNSTFKNSGKTKFEEDLAVYFPEIYRFWSLMKFDPYYQELIEGIVEMVDGDAYGTIRIVYQGGKINSINLDKQLTANKSRQKP